MIDRNRLVQSLYAAVDEINKQLSVELQLEKSLETVIIGTDGKLDSLGVTNLIVATESKASDDLGITLNLAEIYAVSPDGGPLKTIGSLVDYIISTQENK